MQIGARHLTSHVEQDLFILGISEIDLSSILKITQTQVEFPRNDRRASQVWMMTKLVGIHNAA